ncbi:MAG: sulfate adenylyltransferase [Candidatus Sumerlaeaceae bacterium]
MARTPAPIKQIAPHGGKLIDRCLQGADRTAAIEKAKSLKKLVVDDRTASDIEIIGVGAVSPLTGFQNPDDYDQVVKEMHLTTGTPWTIPVTLGVSKDEAAGIKEGDQLALEDGDSGTLLAILTVDSKYSPDKKLEAANVYGTDDEKHPGVAAVYGKGDVYLGGDIDVINLPPHDDFLQYRLTPEQSRAAFLERGWRRVVAFQTRNPIHRAHEYMQKVAMEITDGLFLHPLVGNTKGDDVPADVRMRTYETIVEKYYPANHTLIGVNPAAMRYAGPREAIFHALIRKNYGCTHFIVGRDHAGVGNYYGTFDAHFIFDEFQPGSLDITPLFFDYTFYCKECGGMGSTKSCPHSKDHHITLSGTKVREMLGNGELPPPEFTRPEVAQILIEAYAEQAAAAK